MRARSDIARSARSSAFKESRPARENDVGPTFQRTAVGPVDDDGAGGRRADRALRSRFVVDSHQQLSQPAIDARSDLSSRSSKA
jgi:hypothetical protein